MGRLLAMPAMSADVPLFWIVALVTFAATGWSLAFRFWRIAVKLNRLLVEYERRSLWERAR